MRIVSAEVPEGDPNDFLSLRAQLALARKRDKARACPDGKKCKVACAAPHVQRDEDNESDFDSS